MLDTSEALTAAEVYQTAGTRVGVEVPLTRPLQRDHVYYVAFKALDDDGHHRLEINLTLLTSAYNHYVVSSLIKFTTHHYDTH